MSFNLATNPTTFELAEENFNWIEETSDCQATASFCFVNFNKKYVENLLSSCDSCLVSRTAPFQKEYRDVIYTPYVRIEHNKRYGCLYNRDGQRIEHSCLKQDKKYLVKDAISYSGTKDLETFAGNTIYLGIILGHYGHFLLETISRWWSLIDRLQDFDYYLFHLPNPKILEKSWVKELLALAGIEREKIIYFEKPTKIQSVFVPEASLQIGSHIFKQYREVCQHLISLIDLTKIQTTDRPLYLSRRLLNRGARKVAGEELLEDLLLRNGFHVVHPQFLSIEEQIYLINRHEHIVGIVGSAMHNLVFSLSAKTVTYIASENNLPPSYIMLDKLCQNRSTYVNSYKPIQINSESKDDNYSERLEDFVFSKTAHSQSQKRVDIARQKSFNREYTLNFAAIRQYLDRAGYLKKSH
jgi:capsular polysaccharide biosynthesis protein